MAVAGSVVVRCEVLAEVDDWRESEYEARQPTSFAANRRLHCACQQAEGRHTSEDKVGQDGAEDGDANRDREEDLVWRKR